MVDITKITIKLSDCPDKKLKAYCSIIIDNCLVIHDIRIISGKNGLFVAMPSRKLMDSCTACTARNHAQATYCNNCGHKLPTKQYATDHFDIVHPINQASRAIVTDAIITAYQNILTATQECSQESASI